MHNAWTLPQLLEQRRVGERRNPLHHHLLLSRLSPLDGTPNLGTTCTALAFCPDDTKLVIGDEHSRLQIWNPDYGGGSIARSFDTGHTGSIQCVRFLDGSRGAKLVSCSSDRQVRLIDLQRQATRSFLCHRARVRGLASLSPDVFLSASEDGTVRLFDIRQAARGPTSEGSGAAGAAAGGAPRPDSPHLLVEQRCERSGRSGGSGSGGSALQRISINSLAVSPLAPHLFVTGGGDPFARMYDMRMLRGVGGGGNGAGQSAWRPTWVCCFAPRRMCSPSLVASAAAGFSSPGRVRHLTGLAFAAGGQHLLLSYSGDAIYSLCTREHAMGCGELEDRLRRRAAAAAAAQPAAGSGSGSRLAAAYASRVGSAQHGGLQPPLRGRGVAAGANPGANSARPATGSGSGATGPPEGRLRRRTQADAVADPNQRSGPAIGLGASSGFPPGAGDSSQGQDPNASRIRLRIRRVGTGPDRRASAPAAGMAASNGNGAAAVPPPADRRQSLLASPARGSVGSHLGGAAAAAHEAGQLDRAAGLRSRVSEAAAARAFTDQRPQETADGEAMAEEHQEHQQRLQERMLLSVPLPAGVMTIHAGTVPSAPAGSHQPPATSPEAQSGQRAAGPFPTPSGGAGSPAAGGVAAPGETQPAGSSRTPRHVTVYRYTLSPSAEHARPTRPREAEAAPARVPGGPSAGSGASAAAAAAPYLLHFGEDMPEGRSPDTAVAAVSGSRRSGAGAAAVNAAASGSGLPAATGAGVATAQDTDMAVGTAVGAAGHDADMAVEGAGPSTRVTAAGALSAQSRRERDGRSPADRTRRRQRRTGEQEPQQAFAATLSAASPAAAAGPQDLSPAAGEASRGAVTAMDPGANREISCRGGTGNGQGPGTTGASGSGGDGGSGAACSHSPLAGWPNLQDAQRAQQQAQQRHLAASAPVSKRRRVQHAPHTGPGNGGGGESSPGPAGLGTAEAEPLPELQEGPAGQVRERVGGHQTMTSPVVAAAAAAAAAAVPAGSAAAEGSGRCNGGGRMSPPRQRRRLSLTPGQIAPPAPGRPSSTAQTPAAQSKAGRGPADQRSPQPARSTPTPRNRSSPPAQAPADRLLLAERGPGPLAVAEDRVPAAEPERDLRVQDEDDYDGLPPLVSSPSSDDDRMLPPPPQPRQSTSLSLPRVGPVVAAADGGQRGGGAVAAAGEADAGGGGEGPDGGEGGADGGGFLRCFDGHKNVMTVKEVAWLGGSGYGPSYVASGSDDGHVFIWEYDTGEIVRMLPLREQVIPTSLAVHPAEPMIASCGLGTTVKVWAPGGSAAAGAGTSATCRGRSRTSAAAGLTGADDGLSRSANGNVDPETQDQDSDGNGGAEGEEEEAAADAAAGDAGQQQPRRSRTGYRRLDEWQRRVVAANRADLLRRQREADAEAVGVGRGGGRPLGAGWATFAAAIRDRANEAFAAAAAPRVIGAAANDGRARAGPGPDSTPPRVTAAAATAAAPQAQTTWRTLFMHAREQRRQDLYDQGGQQQQLGQSGEGGPSGGARSDRRRDLAARRGEGSESDEGDVAGTPQRARGRGRVLRLSTALDRQARRSGSPEETIPAFGMTPPAAEERGRGAGRVRWAGAEQEGDGEEEGGGGEGGGGMPYMVLSPQGCALM